MIMQKLYESLFTKENDKGIICPKVLFFESIGSTNDYLNDLAAKGAASGTTVVSYCQTNGHGRSGRSFFSPKGGNLYMSILLRPDDLNKLGLITPAAAVAVVRAIKKIIGIDTAIKWVNDIFYRNRKVCGILASAYGFEAGKPYVILGIGVNVYVQGDMIPSELKDIYGTLLSDEKSQDEVLELIPYLAHAIFTEYVDIYNDMDSSDFMEEYRRKSLVIGKKVSYLSGKDTVNVEVIDIDDEGGLVVRENDGIVHTYKDGEIRIKI